MRMAVCQQLIVAFALLVCASADHLTAVAEFNQGGVVGTITFSRLDNGSTQINTSFTSGNFSGWHVHVYPADYTDDPATRCGGFGTGPHYDPTGRYDAAGENYTLVCNMSNPLGCEAGDFSGKFGPLMHGEFSFIDSDPILQLSGQYGIVGRSVVIHAPDNSRIACANIILEDDTPQIFVATFLGPVAGSIYFRQSQEDPEVGTFIHAKLFHTDGTTTDTQGLQWGIYKNKLDILDYSQGVCNLGELYNPNEVDLNAPECSPSNISFCAVGDLTRKLGTISVSGNPIRGMIGAWTDGNLHNYTINGQSVGIYVSNSEQPLACANIVELPVTSGIVDVDTTLFTMSQRSPFDPTIINVGVDIPMADYQINNDGNVRDNMQGMQSTTCYSNMVYQPFEPFQPVDNNVTLDSYAVGNLSSKHMIEGGLALSDKILPLTNLYSALGHNVMVTPNDGSRATCGTLGFTEGSNVRIIRASAGFDSDAMTGYVRLMQIFTMSDGQFIAGPTLLYWQLRHNVPGMEATVRHNWHVHVYRTPDTSPSTMCNGFIGGHFNPFSVEVGSDLEMEVCNEAVGSRYQLRCELGDLSGKFGWLVIRGTDSSQETTVVTDSNLPLAGPYTVLGRSIAIHSDITPSEIIACANIEPEVLSARLLRLSFPVPADTSIDIRVSLPAAIVDTLGDSEVEHGEVLVYELIRDFLRFDPTTECHVATIRFTDFTGNADLVADRVIQLDQDRLPEMYQRGPCPDPAVLDDTDGSSSIQPTHLLLMVTSLLGFAITLGNILL